MLKSEIVTTDKQLILASASPRRNELLCLLGVDFLSRPTNIDERKHEDESPQQYVERMAREKGEALPRTVEQVVLSADTIVDLDGLVLGKPTDDEDAACILKLMRNKTHRVHTALSVHIGENGATLDDICQTHVPMRDYSNEEIQAYIARDVYRDKAGGYAIQDEGFHPVEVVDGCYANVMGLPLCNAYNLLRKVGFVPNPNIALDCQRYNQIRCTVYPLILQEEQDEKTI